MFFTENLNEKSRSLTRTRVEAKVSATESNQTVAPRDVPFLGTGTAVAVSRRDEGTVVKIALNR